MKRFMNFENAVSVLLALYAVAVLLKDMGVIGFEEPIDLPIILSFYFIFVGYQHSRKKKEGQG